MMNPENDNRISDACLQEIRHLTHALTGITIAESRKSMVLSRLNKRLIANSLFRFEDYLDLVRKDPEEARFFIDSMTTNETYFYRTPRIWSYLIDLFVPEFIAAKHGRPLRLWSAAASTGEEAHTAGVLLESLRERNAGFDYRILGTDISPRVVRIAQKGSYSGRSIERFRDAQPELFRRYLAGTETEGFSVSVPIRERLKFETHNLFSSARPGAGFDVVLLRNVLIYFTKPDQQKALENIRRMMTDGGALIIGESETLSSLTTEFQSVAPFVYSPAERPAKAVA